MKIHTLTLNDHELAVVLASVRYAQDAGADLAQDMPDHMNGYCNLAPQKIDELCERINGAAEPAQA